MYRSLLLLIIASASSAPQTGKDTESDITYVKIQPITEQSAPAKTPYRESRIENLRLTVPNAGAKGFRGRRFKNRNEDSKEVLVNEKSFVNTRPLVLESDERRDVLVNEKGFVNTPPLVLVSDERKDVLVNEKGLDFGKSIEFSEFNDRKTVYVNDQRNDIQKDVKHAIEGDLPDELDIRKNLEEKHFTEPNSYENYRGIEKESNLSKRSPDSTLEPKELNESRPLETPELPKLEEKKFYLEDTENSFVNTPPSALESDERNVLVNEKGFDNTQKIRNEESEETTKFEDISVTTSEVTEKNEYLQTKQYEARTRAPTPRFLSKLSYLHKNDEENSLVTNFIERSGLAVSGYRMFVSKCRCEKIWSCPKLQITVGRCPNEYFLCC